MSQVDYIPIPRAVGHFLFPQVLLGHHRTTTCGSVTEKNRGADISMMLHRGGCALQMEYSAAVFLYPRSSSEQSIQDRRDEQHHSADDRASGDAVDPLHGRVDLHGFTVVILVHRLNPRPSLRPQHGLIGGAIRGCDRKRIASRIRASISIDMASSDLSNRLSGIFFGSAPKIVGRNAA